MKKTHIRKEIAKEGDTCIWYAETPLNQKTIDIFLYKTMINYVRVIDPESGKQLSAQSETSEKYQELLKRLGFRLISTKKERTSSKDYFYTSTDDMDEEDYYEGRQTYEKIPIKAEIKGGKIVITFSGNHEDVSENFFKMKTELKKEKIEFTLIDDKDKLRDCSELEKIPE